MNYLFQQKISVTIVVFIAFIITSCGNDTENPEDKLQNTPGWFYSEILNSQRYINIRLPADYNPLNDKHYPTIYLLDATWYYDGTHYRIDDGGVKKIVEDLIDNQIIPEVIIVGIGNVDIEGMDMRESDFLYDGADAYHRFLTQELIPLIDSRYKTKADSIADRTLIGHSSAAYLCMHTFCQMSPVIPNPFQKYIALSVFHSNAMADIKSEEEEMYARMYGYWNLDTNVFLGVGSEEENEFINTFNYLIEKINSRPYTDFNLGHQMYENHNHLTYVGKGIEDGIKYVFLH